MAAILPLHCIFGAPNNMQSATQYFRLMTRRIEDSKLYRMWMFWMTSTYIRYWSSGVIFDSHGSVSLDLFFVCFLHCFGILRFELGYDEAKTKRRQSS